METDFIPIDYDYFDFQEKNYIKIFGRDSKGKRVCVIDSCPVYLWAILEHSLDQRKIQELIKEIGKIELDLKGRKTKVESVELHKKRFLGKDVNALKIFATNYKDLHDIADRLALRGIEKRRGYDLGFVMHYILERKIIPLHWYKIQGQILNNSLEFGGVDSNLDVDMCMKLESVKRIEDVQFKPRVLAYDIEADDIKIGGGDILMISLVTKDFNKVITWKKPTTGKKQEYVEYVKDESELIEKFIEYVKKLSPDFLVGYFSDGFDMPYLKARAEKNKMKLSLSLDSGQPRFSRGIEVSAKTKGIVHVDLLKFIRTAYSQYMQSETLSLNEVAHEFLGDSKKGFKIKHSSKLSDSNWIDYFEYNLHDSVLVYNLFEKMWPDMLEFSRIMHEPISEVSRNGMSKNVEAFIISNLERFDEIPEKRPTNEEVGERRRREKYVGAFVFEPTPGLYENISVFDFTSSYGSTIVTYNLSKSTFIDKPEKGKSYTIEVDGKEVSFDKTPGFFPEMLKDIIEKRKKYKEELKKKPDVIKRARSNAFKLLANASYGYQGFFGARYYSREAAAATAAFARKSILDSIDKINNQGYKVIYSDTDSIAFLMEKRTESETTRFLDKLNSELPGIMELELEGFFTRGLWVTKRTGKIGAKKKYALLGRDGKLKIRGFETVRRDWCSLARKTQNEILRMVLEDGNEKRALDHVKDVIKKLKERKISKEELIIKTMLQKPLSEYKAISPHVIAARKMEEREIPIDGGGLIEYFIAETREKKKLVREKVKLPDEKGEYNIEYYLKKQILPAVENIFQVFNINTNEIIEGKKQTKLVDF